MLSAADLAELEATLLPALERHHLRLLAHALRTFQQAAGGPRGPLPAAAALEAWARQQPLLASDPAFQAELLNQLAKAAAQIEAIARACGREPLALELADLVAWGRQQADQRLAGQEPGPEPHSSASS
ncbi:MAG: hypothetical protein R6W06_11330 [Prochlorococcaceae cyanobacterium]